MMRVKCVLFLLLFIFFSGLSCSTPFSGYKINTEDKDGNSPLHHAAGTGELDLAKHLVSQGADINTKNNVGETPLHLASYNGHLALVKYLVSEGADIDAKDKYGSTPFQDAIKINKFEVAKYLAMQGANVNSQAPDGTTPLHYAVTTGNLKVIKFLLSHGAHINLQDNFGNSALHQASRLDDLAVAKLLVSQGADIDMMDKYGNSPVLKAAESGSFDVIKFLVSQGADISHKNNNEATALDLATLRGYTNIAIYLYSETNRLNRPSFHAKTEASIKAHLEIIPEDIRFGNYHALVIGNNDYKFMPKLKTAINDANAVSKLLQESYGYDVKMIANGTRREILSSLDKFRNELNEDDNLLIYYAGHGYFDKGANRGYWLPVDSNYGTSADWISNADITDKLKALQAKHVIVVADSCYSGTLTRGLTVVTKRSSDYLQRISRIRSRTVLTSGGFEPVVDSVGGNHSVFANAFLEILGKNTGIMDGTQLFSELRRPVMVNAPQTPQYSDIRFAGHEGGDFLFIRMK
jgi:ankyrin repeat protein